MMKIRKANVKDYNSLKKIKLLSKKEELKYSNTLNPLSESEGYFLEYLKLDLTKQDGAVFIAEEDGKVVGMILCKFFKPFKVSRYSKKGYISNLYVDKAYRGNGVGERLVKEVIKWFKENNVSYLSLEIYVDNLAAQKLYHKLGFKDYTIKMSKIV